MLRLEFFDFFCGISHDKSIIWYVSCYDRSEADYGILSNSHSPQYSTSAGDPRVFFDVNRFGANRCVWICRTVCFRTVEICVDDDRGTDDALIFNGDFFLGLDFAAIEADVVSNLDF